MLPVAIFGLLSLAAAKASEDFSLPSGRRRRRSSRALRGEAEEGHIFASAAPPGGRFGAVTHDPNPLTDVIVHIDPATFQILKGWRTDEEGEGHPIDVLYEAPNVDAATFATVGLFPGTWRFNAVTLDGRIASTTAPIRLYPGDRIRIEPGAPPRPDPMGRTLRSQQVLDVHFV